MEIKKDETVNVRQQGSALSFDTVSDPAVNGMYCGQRAGSILALDPVSDTAASSLIDLRQNTAVSNLVLDTTADSVFVSSNVLSNSSEHANGCGFLTLEQFVKEETDLNSFDELLSSDLEIGFPIIKAYFKKCHAKLENFKPVQLISFVVILVYSIFSQLFGGNRNLPVA